MKWKIPAKWCRNDKKAVHSIPPYNSFFIRRRIKKWAVILLTFVLYTAASSFTGFTNIHTLIGIPKGIYWLIYNFFPTPQSLSIAPLILSTLMNTIILAISATTLAAFIAFIMAIFGSHTTGHFFICRLIIAGIASFFRNIPLPAWAILLLLSFKQNNTTGFLALFFLTCGHLIRVFTEIIDSHAEKSYTALEAAGVPYLAIIFHGVLPNVLPLFISWLLYAIETNVRDSALVGILTGTGIGFLFNLYFKSFRYNEAGLIILMSSIIVLCIDFFSNKIRRILL